jgi:hypothetical protein
MQPQKFRKKPVVIEAMLLDWVSVPAIEAFVTTGFKGHYDPTGKLDGVDIATLEGTMRANLGDWIIKGVQGEFYSCKPDIFEATYDKVEMNELGAFEPGSVIPEVKKFDNNE